MVGWKLGGQSRRPDDPNQGQLGWRQKLFGPHFTVKGVDQSETYGWEVIGWDPAKQQIRSWIFDSNGGFGESTWAYDGEHWLIKAANVLPNRRPATHLSNQSRERFFPSRKWLSRQTAIPEWHLDEGLTGFCPEGAITLSPGF